MSEASADFSFPVLPGSSAEPGSLGDAHEETPQHAMVAEALPKAPLTSRSTVTVAGPGATKAPKPIAEAVQAKEPRPKKVRDPEYLTRSLYTFLSKFIPTYTRVPLEKGYSQVDWLRLTRTDRNLNGLNGQEIRKDITMEEVKQHNTKDDAWMVFRNKVYNITPYLRFHPGGVDVLMKAAGRDGTALFLKYHAWVNADALMESCLVGYLAERP